MDSCLNVTNKFNIIFATYEYKILNQVYPRNIPQTKNQSGKDL